MRLWLVFASDSPCDPVRVTLALWTSVFSPDKWGVGTRPTQVALIL